MERLSGTGPSSWLANLPALATGDGKMKAIYFICLRFICHYCHFFHKSKKDKTHHEDCKTFSNVVAKVARPP
jgi:hypothetical protein